MQSHGHRRKKQEGLIQINQNDILLSPHIESAEQSIGICLQQKFAKLQQRQKMKFISNALHNLYGRHNAIPYKPEFEFQERWQQISRPNYYQSKYSLLKTENWILNSLHCFILVSYTVTTWFLSIYRLFSIDSSFICFFCINVLTQLVDVFTKNWLVNKAVEQDRYAKVHLSAKDYIKLHWVGILTLMYLLVMLLQNQFGPSIKQMSFYPIDLFFVWKGYQRFKQVYSVLKIKILSSKFRNQFQILQLFGRCLLLVHLFGVILYMVSLTNYDQNWTITVINFNLGWLYKYVYSLYFACTTMFTVGYGDITPKNLGQILTILCVQVLGIINLGYIISQIGRILSKINENQQILYKNISQAEKLAQNYKLPQSLAGQMRSYIINNQIANDQLNVQEEDNFMRKLNDQIRQGITSLNQIRIIKSSVFFICHWSKKFQRRVAGKLLRSVYSPQETLNWVRGKEKIYILARGKIDIEACLISQPHQSMRKALATLQINSKREVQFNVYGYSSLISGLQINLRAVVKDYSICYSLSKQDITNAMIEDDNDFQYFHEIKVRIEQSYFKQIWQAPSISNTREHYLPNPYYILKKTRLQDRKTQTRRNTNLRKYQKSKCYIQSEIQPSEHDIDSQNSEEQDNGFVNIELNMLMSDSQDKGNMIDAVLSPQQRRMKYNCAQNNDFKPCMITSRNYKQKLITKQRTLDQSQLLIKQKNDVLCNFQEKKHYRTFYLKYNPQKLIDRYNKLFCKLPESVTVKSLSQIKMQTKVFDQITEDVLHKLLNVKMMGSQSFD